MKKALLLVSILFISVISTACINNFAVQELNNKAKEFMDKGDYQEAIGRLKASLDLDESLFETHYNLAVAYTKADDYLKAVESYTNALKINPDFAEAYYSLAVCEENLAKDIISGAVIVNEDGTLTNPTKDDICESDENDSADKKELSDNEKTKIAEILNKSVEDYKIYLEKTPGAADKADVESQIESLNELISEYAALQENEE